MTPEQWAAIIAAAGLPLILSKVVDGIAAWRSGRAADERRRNSEAASRIARTETALAECRRILDGESTYRRLLAEHAHHLRSLLLDAGWSPSDLPEWPAHPHRT